MRHLGTLGSLRGLGLLLALAAGLTSAFLAFSSNVSGGSQLGVNLLQNPGAEENTGATQFGCNAEPCSNPGPHNDPPAQWTIPDPGGNFTAVKYSASGSYAPPPGGGNNYFAGGYRPGPYTATQAVIVSSLATQIDATTIQADLSADLAGYSGESSSPRVTANFYPGTTCAGTPLGSFNIALTQAERVQNTFLNRSGFARVPTGTRLICVVMEPDGSITDYGDVYFDNLSLTLSQVPPLATTTTASPPTTTTPPPTTTTPPPTTPPPPSTTNININVAPNITTSIATGLPVPSTAIPPNTTVDYNPQTGQFFIRVQYKIKEKPLRKLCKKGCAGRSEIRTRTGAKLFRPAVIFGGLPGDGGVLGTRSGLRFKTGGKVRFDIAINKARLLDLDFTTEGGFRVAQTRMRIWLKTPLGTAQTVRDGRIRVSIARIESGALPGLQGILG